MKNSKSTKRALVSSMLAILMCMTMLIGTTFAWFTDTASTAVNKIQSGTLKVDLEVQKADGTWESAVGQTLNFKKAADAPAGEKILWEPGCTYELPALRVVNNGNLALKYKIVITGINGDAELNDVIDWTISDTNLDANHSLAAGATSGILTIKGHMQETAGNDYQNLSIDGIGITVVATQDTVEYDSEKNTYDDAAEYPTITTAGTLEEVFDDANVDFGYGNTSTEAVNLDGKGVAVVEDWTDAWINSDTTIKGVTFKNGAVFTTKADNVTVTLENCTFYACDQDATAKALGLTGENGTGNNGRNNIMTNSGAGMCLNLEQKGSTEGVKFIVKNCTFVGENDSTLPVWGNNYNADGSYNVNNPKKRGHAIALNAISGGGTAGTLESLMIEGCVINGVRGNAIQLYGTTGAITIKDTKINSWGVNSGEYTLPNGTVKDANSAAIRGDFNAGGSRTLTIQNVYFGLDESTAVINHEIKHVNVGSFSGNTDGRELAGTYSK